MAHVKVSKRDHPPIWKYSHSFKFVTSNDSGHVSIYSSKRAAAAGKSKEKYDFDPEKFFGETNSKKPGTLTVHEFGTALFKALFSGAAGASLTKMNPDDCILLEMDDDDLDAIPWEYSKDLKDSNGSKDSRFLVHLHKFARLQSSQNSLLPSSTPLRIVTAVPDPIYLSRKFPDLYLSDEVQVFINGFTEMEKAVYLKRAFPPTRERTIELLGDDSASATVFHFMGHCVQKGLVFENNNGNEEYVEASRLSIVSNKLQLAFLSACDTREIAQSLARRGIPYTIGSNRAILNNHARKFESGFYRFLANNHTVEEAMHNARLQFHEPVDDHFVGAMVLYLPTATLTRKERVLFECNDGKPDIVEHMPRNNPSGLYTMEKELSKL